MFNYAIQNSGRLAFSGAAAASPAIDIRHHVGFSFSIEVIADIATAAVFNIQAAPASDADPCLPGAFVDVPEIVICDAPAIPGTKSQFTIPAGTKAGALCSGALPCRPDAFIKVLPVSGDTANTRIIVGLHGPR